MVYVCMHMFVCLYTYTIKCMCGYTHTSMHTYAAIKKNIQKKKEFYEILGSGKTQTKHEYIS